MRVISGIARGHRLVTPAGEDTRPTADRVKEALFSIVQGSVGSNVVLDLFAGSGALGIEALSRGAAWCDFVESDDGAAKAVAANLQKTRFENCALARRDAFAFLADCERKYDLVLLDPPYRKGLCERAMDTLYRRSLVAEGGIVVCETSAEEQISSSYKPLRQYQYGTVRLWLFANETEIDKS